MFLGLFCWLNVALDSMNEPYFDRNGIRPSESLDMNLNYFIDSFRMWELDFRDNCGCFGLF